MNWLSRLLREPLLHFLMLAGLIFYVYNALHPEEGKNPDRIEVSEARLEQLAGLFAKTWQRPPTDQELKGLIDEFIKEEIAYREALVMGLDKDDAVIRRRLRQKLEFLGGAELASNPTDDELQTFLNSRADQYAIEPKVALRQIYFDPQRRSTTLEDDTTSALAELRANPAAEEDRMGDDTMLPQTIELSPLSVVAREFGKEFAQAVSTLEEGVWSGPIRSGYGTHLVKVTKRAAGEAATLANMRTVVTRDYMSYQQKAREEDSYKELLKKYDVIIASPPKATIEKTGAKN